MLRWVVLALFISLCAIAEAQNKKKVKTATAPLSRGEVQFEQIDFIARLN